MSPGVTIGIVVLVVLTALVLVAMRGGWLRRERRTRLTGDPLPAVPPEAARGQARTDPIRATYVTTTFGGQRFERVVAHQLGVRSVAVLQVHDAGVEIGRDGASDLFIPTAALRSVGRSAGMIGKVVDRDGLVVITWALGDRVLDTGLRTRHAADRVILTDAVASLLDHAPHPTSTPSSEEHA